MIKKIITVVVLVLLAQVTMAQIQPDGNLVLPGSNKWILQTPDDGRTSLYIAPWNTSSSSWDWEGQFEFKNNAILKLKEVQPEKLFLYVNDYLDSAYGIYALNNNDRFIYDNRKLFHYGLGFYTNDTKEYNKLYLSSYHGINFFVEGKLRMMIRQNGNVGIGTSNPDEKLTVKGKIHAEEVKVDLQVPADYVFQKYYTGTSDLKQEYTLPTLQEVEQFTQVNYHLPNIPSAKEIQENGLQLGEMTNLLLQKIEELTLYIIEQQKQIDELKKIIK